MIIKQLKPYFRWRLKVLEFFRDLIRFLERVESSLSNTQIGKVFDLILEIASPASNIISDGKIIETTTKYLFLRTIFKVNFKQVSIIFINSP